MTVWKEAIMCSAFMFQEQERERNDAEFGSSQSTVLRWGDACGKEGKIASFVSRSGSRHQHIGMNVSPLHAHFFILSEITEPLLCVTLYQALDIVAGSLVSYAFKV